MNGDFKNMSVLVSSKMRPMKTKFWLGIFSAVCQNKGLLTLIHKFILNKFLSSYILRCIFMKCIIFLKNV